MSEEQEAIPVTMPPTVETARQLSIATVSVIIPCHNYGRFLAEAIESALAQTHPADEILIVDDGSTDDSLAVARRYAGRPGVRIIAQANQGAIATYNAGIRASTGTFFVILSADDRLDPRFLERTVPELVRAPQAAYVYTAYRMFGGRHRMLPARPFDAWLLARRPYIAATALMRRAAFDAAGGFSAAMAGGHEDWDFYVTLVQHGWSGVALPEVLFHYRKHSSTSRNALSFRRWMAVRARVYRRHRSLYRIPLPLFLIGAVLDVQWLRVKAAPRAALRRLGPERRPGRAPRGMPRACLLLPASASQAARAVHHAGVIGLALPTVVLAPGHAGGDRVERRTRYSVDAEAGAGFLRFDLPRARGVLGEWPQLWSAAVCQRAALYLAYDLQGLLAGAVAASRNHARLVYAPPTIACRGPILRRLLERIALWRVDALLATTQAMAAGVQRRYHLPSTVIAEQAAASSAADGIEDLRLRQLCLDLLP